MKSITAGAAVALLAIGIGMATAQAEERKVDNGGRDLNVETQRPSGGGGGGGSSHRHSRRPIHASVMTIGPSSIAVGDPLGFRMTATADGYGSLYVLSASGRTQLWLENVRLHAGEPISFPRHGLVVRASPPAGDETIIFLATRDRFDGLNGRGTTTSPMDLQFTHAGLREAIQHKLNDLEPNRFGFAEVQIRVHD